MLIVWRSFRTLAANQQHDLIQAICCAVKAFSQHRCTTRKKATANFMTAMAELPIKAAYIAFFSECFLILDAQPGTKALPTVVPVLCQPTLDQQVYFHNPAGGRA